MCVYCNLALQHCAQNRRVRFRAEPVGAQPLPAELRQFLATRTAFKTRGVAAWLHHQDVRGADRSAPSWKCDVGPAFKPGAWTASTFAPGPDHDQSDREFAVGDNREVHVVVFNHTIKVVVTHVWQA